MERWGIFTETGAQKHNKLTVILLRCFVFSPEGVWCLRCRSRWNTEEDIGIKYETEKLKIKEGLLLSVQTLLIFVQDYDELEAEHFPSLKKPSLAPAKKKPHGIEILKNYSAKTGSVEEAEGGGN